MALVNLKAEMTRSGITQAEMAAFLGMTPGNLNKKVLGKTPFTVPEAKAIKNKYFPNLSLDYLFSSNSCEA